jgi:mannobiose 2-epimerase
MYTTNTLLHMLEAYTNLYKASQPLYVKDKINELLHGFFHELYDEEKGLIYMYLDKDRKGCYLGQSYGHDIESSWLIDLALKETGIVHQGIENMTKTICEKVLERAMTDQGLFSERLNGHISKDRIWWVQAEAMVGFYNYYQKTGSETYKEAVAKIYDFTMHHLVDQRRNAEWLWGVDEHMQPITYRGFAEHWKANYHNGRAFIELLKRGLT